MKISNRFLVTAASIASAASPALAADPPAQMAQTAAATTLPPPDLAATIIFFGSLVAMVAISQAYATRRERMRQETLRAMVEKGLEIPRGLLDGARASADLRRGLVLVAAGLGLSLALALAQLDGGGATSRLWSIGAVPSLVGVGYLVAWRIGARERSGG